LFAIAAKLMISARIHTSTIIVGIRIVAPRSFVVFIDIFIAESCSAAGF